MIQFNSKYNSNLTTKVNKFQMKKLFWVFVIFSLFLIGIGVLGIIDGDIFAGSLLVFIGVFYIPLVWWLTKAFQKKLDKSNSIMSNETEQFYKFDENKFSISEKKGEEYRAEVEATYNYFYKVVEDKDNYFLFQSRVQIHVVPKDTLVDGTLEEFNKLLESKLGNKFKKRKK